MSQKGDSGKKMKVNKEKKTDGKSKKVVGGAKHSKTKNFNRYSRFIHNLLKNAHPDIGVTKNGMNILNSFVVDLADRIGTEAGFLAKYHKHATMSMNHMIGAIKLVLPPEIAAHAIEEGQKAYKSYVAATKTAA